MILDLLVLYLYALIFATIGVAIYGVVARSNVAKKIIALTILGDTVNLLLVLLGYRFVERPAPPVVTSLVPTSRDIEYLVEHGVDPLLQAFVITAIVINLAVTALLVFLAIHAYHRFGTLEMDEMGGEV